MKTEYKYLGRVNSPEDLKKVSNKEIPDLCQEIRQCIVTTTENNGGHLASNLGVVELSVAIHRVFDCPKDHIIFDVGHQSYTHKLLTERFEKFGTLRQPGGLSGFTSREESEYDCFGAGHSSTSLSAALGFAESDIIKGSDAYTVVVLGDGAFTGGMIHEALNNLNKDLTRLIIILNENEMSISKNIGRFAATIAKLRKKNGYFRVKRFTISFIKKIPLVGKGIFKAIRGIKKSVKNALYGSTYFEDLGLYYLGPADGNDYESVEELLRQAKRAGENVLVHLKTQKGKGYEPAETDPHIFHGVSPQKNDATQSSFSLEFGNALCELANENEKICAITAAMGTGTGLECFQKKFGDRFFDVGIAEGHAVTFASGIAANGLLPVFAVYSTFMQRGYDQIIHDAALQNLPVVFGLDRAGFNNSDGVTHHGIFDVAFFSQLPDVKIYTPVTYKGLALSLSHAIEENGVKAIRYPAGCENKKIIDTFYNCEECNSIGIRTDFSLKDVPKNVIITHGRIVSECIDAKKTLEKEGIEVGILLCEYIAPYTTLADEINALIGDNIKAVAFVEEEIRAGGFGMMLSGEMKRRGYLDNTKYTIMAVEDPFVNRWGGESYLEASGLCAKNIVDTVKKLV